MDITDNTLNEKSQIHKIYVSYDPIHMIFEIIQNLVLGSKIVTSGKNHERTIWDDVYFIYWLMITPIYTYVKLY